MGFSLFLDFLSSVEQSAWLLLQRSNLQKNFLWKFSSDISACHGKILKVVLKVLKSPPGEVLYDVHNRSNCEASIVKPEMW